MSKKGPKKLLYKPHPRNTLLNYQVKQLVEVLGIRALISYEGTNAKELVEDFRGAVDAYLEL